MSNKINSFCNDTALAISNSKSQNVSNKYFNVLKAVAGTSLGCIYIIDLESQKIEFISQNPILFSGFKTADIEKIGFNFFHKYVKADDLEILKKVNSKGLKFFECLIPEEKKRHTITYDFHIKNSNNVDVLINHKITPIELFDNGGISKVVCVASYSLNRTAGNIRVMSNTSETYWRYNLFTGKWSEEYKIKLKIREIEIIRLYLQGFKIDEIAEKLFVAPSTIKFHRSKLFEKIGVNNIVEAISYVVTNNLI